MAKFFDHLNSKLQAFVEKQALFFVATATCEGRINLSPKGMDTLRVLHPNRLLWLNLTGSGNETAAHLRENSRMTIMFCAFEGNPLILRLYGQAKAYHERDAIFQEYLHLFSHTSGARQIIDLQIESVQTSCGFAVPLMEFKENRPILTKWSDDKGKEGLREYWQQRNTMSIDGQPTGIMGED